MIYTLLASIGKAINTLEGIKTDVNQKVISLIYLDCSFISYTTSTSRDSFISSYCTYHNLDTIPSRTIHPLLTTHNTATERDTELLLHTKSLQRQENNGLQTFPKAIEGIIIMPSVSYKKQIEENNGDIILKKLSNEIILGKTTESTAMELDAEGDTSLEQLQDIIKKECDKRDKNYHSVEQKYNKLQESLEQSQQQKLENEGPRSRLKQKEIIPNHSSKDSITMRAVHFKTSNTTTRLSTTQQTKRKSRRYHQRRLKRKRKKLYEAQAFTIATKETDFLHRPEQAATTIRNKITQQFGFVAEPTKTLLLITSSTLAHTPTWYYFSRHSHLAFHIFTRSKQPAKNLRLLLGLGLKFILTTRCTNTWKKLKESSMPKFKRAIH